MTLVKAFAHTSEEEERLPTSTHTDCPPLPNATHAAVRFVRLTAPAALIGVCAGVGGAEAVEGRVLSVQNKKEGA